MKEFEEKKRRQAFVYSPVSLLVVIVLVFLMAKGAYGMYQKYQLSKDSLDEQTARLDQLKDQKSDLEKDLRLLETEDGEEAIIRERFRVVKPGEELVVVIEEDGGEVSAATVQE